MANGEDITWRDAWDPESAAELLRELARDHANGGDYSTATELLAIASFVEWATEELG